MPEAERRLSPHLRQLETEAIEIMREVAAEFRNPVMLYSIGKDSSVMLHLAMKASIPAKPPFPLLHVDTTWKFREMIAFRDDTARRLGVELIVHINQEGLARGINPIASGSALHTQVMKTEALKQALDKSRLRCGVRRRAARRGKKPRQGAGLLVARAGHVWDPRNQRPELWHLYNTRLRPGETMRVFPLSNWTELDVWQLHRRRGHPGRAALFRQGAAGGATRRTCGSWSMTSACRSSRARRRSMRAGAVPHAGLLSADRRHRSRPPPTVDDIVAEMRERAASRSGRAA